MSNDQNTFVVAKDIPPALPKALELAQAQINSLKNREKVYRRIEELIEQD